MLLREYLTKPELGNREFEEISELSQTVSKEEGLIRQIRDILLDHHLRRTLAPETCEGVVSRCILPDRVKSALSFLVFSLHADNNNLPTANKHLPKALPFIYDEYDLPKSDSLAAFTLYKVGTTSYIFADAASRRVIKLLNYLYINYPNIREATKNYKKKFALLSKPYPFIPGIESCGETFIIMDFLPGAPLNECMRRIWTLLEQDQEKGIDYIEKIILILCDHLARLGEDGLLHQDLSPPNILVEEENDEPKNVYLIDFGYNYVLGERLGSKRLILDLRKYIAPEVFEDYRQATVKSDLYSVGIILLELLNGNELTLASYGRAINYVSSLLPEVASVIESSTEPNPEKRFAEFELKNNLLDTAARATPRVYASLGEEVRDSIKIYRRLYRERREICFISLAQFVFPGFGVLRPLLEHLKVRTTKDKEGKLLLFAALAMIAHFIVLWRLIERVRYDSSGPIQATLEMGSTVAVFDWVIVKGNAVAVLDWVIVTGIPIGLTFSFLALEYYLNIFAQIEISDISKPTDISIRLNSFFFGIGTVVGLIVNPILWPYFCGVGTSVVTLNNYLTYRLIEKEHRREQGDSWTGIEERDRSGRPDFEREEFIRMYSTWWMGMGVYSLGLFAIGFALHYGFAADGWTYVAICIGINLYMLKFNCSRDAPSIRAGLNKEFRRIRRNKAWREKMGASDDA